MGTASKGMGVQKKKSAYACAADAAADAAAAAVWKFTEAVREGRWVEMDCHFRGCPVSSETAVIEQINKEYELPFWCLKS